MEFVTIGSVKVAQVAAEGQPLGSERDAVDLIGSLYGTEADLVAIPVSRLQPEFFQLRTGTAGAFIQKFTNYRVRLAIVGDIHPHMVASAALRDFVHESNKGGAVLFVRDDAALARAVART